MLRAAPSHDAGQIAVAALTFLAEDPDRLARFMLESGMTHAELRQTAGEPAILAAILDYLLADESLLMMFAANAGIPPEEIAPARNKLAGPPPAWDS